MTILFIVSGYPNQQDSTTCVFIQRLVNQIADMGHTCNVIAPVKVKNLSTADVKEKQITDGGNIVNVYFPKYFSLWLNSKSHIDLIGKYSDWAYYNSVQRIIKQDKIKFDAVYAHFIGITATVAAKLGKLYKVPSFAACGESTFWTISKYDEKKRVKALNELTGIISVSSENKIKLQNLGVKNTDKIIVKPNGVDRSKFFPHNKIEARKHFGFDANAFIVGFTGHFIERKGPLRLQKAIDMLDDVYVAYAGKGSQIPQGKNIVLCRSLTPQEMPLFLSAIDVFVLPTLHEGCCNAIVEALACGLPVISSDREFNIDILNDKNSILINPEKPQEIMIAINKLKNDSVLLNKMSKEAVASGEKLDLFNRTSDIIKWIESLK